MSYMGRRPLGPYQVSQICNKEQVSGNYQLITLARTQRGFDGVVNVTVTPPPPPELVLPHCLTFICLVVIFSNKSFELKHKFPPWSGALWSCNNKNMQVGCGGWAKRHCVEGEGPVVWFLADMASVQVSLDNSGVDTDANTCLVCQRLLLLSLFVSYLPVMSLELESFCSPATCIQFCVYFMRRMHISQPRFICVCTFWQHPVGL